MMSVKPAQSMAISEFMFFSPLKASRLDTDIVAHAWNLRH